MQTLRTALFLLCLAAVAALLPGCTRGPNSPYIGPAVGTLSPEQLARVEALINDPDLRFPSDEEYRIGPGDVLSIRMVGQPTLFGDTSREREGDFEVTQSKILTLPMVGAVIVHGKTAAELQDLLTEVYSEFFVDPVMVVSIRKYYRNQFTIVGSVVEPGRFLLEPGDGLMEAIYKAGGLTLGGRTGGMAPGSELILYRERLPQQDRLLLDLPDIVELLRDDDGMIRTHEEYRVPISDFLFRGVLTYNVPLRPNDIIYVVPAGSVNIMGRVKTPGVVFLGPSIQTVAHALTSRGGMRYGAASRVELVRQGEDGLPETFFLNARSMINREEPDFVLRDGDQLFVYTSAPRAVLEWIGNIIGAGTRAGIQATYNPVAGI
jgi:polysaccharide export outer membrane protein